MKRYSNTLLLSQALRAEGFELPEECVDIELIMNLDAPFQLKYLINLTNENLVKLGRALARIGEGV